MCIAILKNDTSCKTLGFGQTKYELEKEKILWKNIEIYRRYIMYQSPVYNIKKFQLRKFKQIHTIQIVLLPRNEITLSVN